MNKNNYYILLKNIIENRSKSNVFGMLSGLDHNNRLTFRPHIEHVKWKSY